MILSDFTTIFYDPAKVPVSQRRFSYVTSSVTSSGIPNAALTAKDKSDPLSSQEFMHDASKRPTSQSAGLMAGVLAASEETVVVWVLPPASVRENCLAAPGDGGLVLHPCGRL